MQEVWVQSPVRELRSYMTFSKKPKQKQYCNNFNKDFKNGLHQKKLLTKFLKKEAKSYVYRMFGF